MAGGQEGRSTDVGIAAAEGCRVGDGLRGEGGDGGAGEHGQPERLAGDVGEDPVGIFAAAEGVVLQELPGAGDADAVEVAGAGGCVVEAEDGG